MPWHIAVTDACPIATPFGLIEDGTDKLVGCYEDAETAGEEMNDLLEAEAMIAAPGIGAVVAHASTATCRRHMTRLATAYGHGATMRPYIPEASGNDAMVVLDGADMDRAADAAALGDDVDAELMLA